MKLPKKQVLHYIGYIGFSLFTFLFSLYLAFPDEALKQRFFSEIEKASHGSIMVKASEMSVAGISGLEMEDVNIFILGDDKPQRVTFDYAEINVHLLATIFKAIGGGDPKSILGPLGGADIFIRHYDGEISSSITEEKSDLTIENDIQNIALHKIPLLSDASPMKLAGELSTTATLQFPTKRWHKKAQGNLNIQLQKVVIGPGSVTTPLGPMSMPVIRIGNITSKWVLDKGKLRIDTWKQSGPDLEESSITGTCSLRSHIASSPIDVTVKFKFNDAFLEKESKVKTMLAASGLKKTSDGFHMLRLGGTLEKPRIQGSNRFKLP